MCGIAGFVNLAGQPADREILERMTATLAHRGPDGDGFLLLRAPLRSGIAGFRSSTCPAAPQPMSNEDGSVWITYNGELYNEPELRKELEAKGHRYRTSCDTESLVHLYEEEGHRVRSSAQRDVRRGDLGREPRPAGPGAGPDGPEATLLRRAACAGGLAFGSEPKAVLAHPGIGRKLEHASLVRYLFYEYVPAPYSIWQSLHKLPRGHALCWEDGSFRVWRYWHPPVASSRGARLRGGVGAILGRAARFGRAHRRSDVPIGVFLSGGIDSSSVAAALCEVEPARNVRTFSIGFEDPSFDESSHARAVARHLGTDHHEQTFSVETVYQLLPQVAAWLDEPFGDASILPTHLLSRFARSEVKVVLGRRRRRRAFGRISDLCRRTRRRSFPPLAPLGSGTRRCCGPSVARRPPQFQLRLQGQAVSQRSGRAASAGTPALAGLVFRGGNRRALGWRRPDRHRGRASVPRRVLDGGADPLSRSLALYQDTYLPEDILTKVDRASMACGLEVRAPFLDAKLVDFMQSLPSSFKFGRNRTKRLLKRAAASRLPASILARPKKGFGIPVANWLRGPLAPLMNQLLGRERLEQQGIFRPDEVARRIAEHQSGQHDHRKPLWTLLIFQLWCDHWLPSAI